MKLNEIYKKVKKCEICGLIFGTDYVAKRVPTMNMCLICSEKYNGNYKKQQNRSKWVNEIRK